MNRRNCIRAGLAIALSASGVGGARSTAHAATPADDSTYDRTLERDGVRFRVRSDNRSSLNRVQIDIDGRLGRHRWTDERAGLVTGAAVGDLDADGIPELYVTLTSAGSGSYGELLGLSLRPGGTLETILLPEDDPASPALRGYQGHDRFEVRDRTLVRRFPVYRPGDPNARASGGTRTLEYRLVPSQGSARRSMVLGGYADTPDAP